MLKVNANGTLIEIDTRVNGVTKQPAQKVSTPKKSTESTKSVGNTADIMDTLKAGNRLLKNHHQASAFVIDADGKQVSRIQSATFNKVIQFLTESEVGAGYTIYTIAQL